MTILRQPITESESREMMLDSYVTYIHRHECATCQNVETFSQCFEVWLHPTKSRNTNLRDLRSVIGDLKPLNMAVLKAQPKKIPICAACVDHYKVVGKPEIVTVRTDSGSWQETLRRKYAPPAAEGKVAKPTTTATKVVPTLDQI